MYGNSSDAEVGAFYSSGGLKLFFFNTLLSESFKCACV